ncbi:PIN domain-containing protein [Nitrosospira multiformis]|uniref:PIN domain-containing protein n=1 Tax=Nitrosospira multiformis TaxID=1231 RepID=UPI000896C430|nr:PIN domain-containing protein [Nitrosospira multiformis]SEA60675.1 PIN domain-containing protein [Nitrosospira multiformis]
MNVSVLLDTSFLISLVDENRTNHAIAAQYYRFTMEQRIPMYFSAIAAAEFAIKQPITDLPLRNFRELHFNIPHGVKAALLMNALGKRDDGDNRVAVLNDIKLIAQAVHEKIPFIITEDASSLFKYCERLRNLEVLDVRAIKLIDGFNPSVFREDDQQGELNLSDPEFGSW